MMHSHVLASGTCVGVGAHCRYREHVVWSDREVVEKLLKKGIFGRIHAPQVRHVVVALCTHMCPATTPKFAFVQQPPLQTIVCGIHVLNEVNHVTAQCHHDMGESKH